MKQGNTKCLSWIVASALLLLVSFSIPQLQSARADGVGGTQCPGGTCARQWRTNLHYNCLAPGANCATNCVCKQVVGFLWRDCYCLPVAVTKEAASCGSGGSWRVVRTSGAVAPNSTASFSFAFHENNFVQVFDAQDVAKDGSLISSHDITGKQIQGTIELSFGSGPPKDIPVEITALDLTAFSSIQLPIFNTPSGDNQLQLETFAGFTGSLNQDTGIIEFLDPVPVTLYNDWFPGGITVYIRPAFEPSSDPDAYDVLMSAVGLLPSGAPIPTVSEWGLIILCLLLMTAGTIVIRRSMVNQEAALAT